MNRTFSRIIKGTLIAGASVFIFLLFFTCEANASEGISRGRKIYDTIMLWFNFGILVFLFIKYAKPALMKFLYGERAKIEKALRAIEEDLDASKKRMSEETDSLDGIDAYLQKTRADILAMGENEKNRILEEARNNAAQMIRDAENELTLKMEVARAMINDILVDQAVAIAFEKVAQAFSDQDDERQLEGFVSGLGEAKHHFTQAS